MSKAISMNCEEWKPIAGYEGLYEVSNHGRIKSLVGFNGHTYVKRIKILNPYKQQGNKNYYRSVVKLTNNKKKKDFRVHRLVAEAFIENTENKPNINHKDGNPLNNRAENLEWCTQSENIKHAYDNDLRMTAYKAIDRQTMLDFLNNGFTYEEIGKQLGISKVTVFNYINRFEITKNYV